MTGIAYIAQTLFHPSIASMILGGIFGVVLSVIWVLLFRLDRTSRRGIKLTGITQVLIAVGLTVAAWWPPLVSGSPWISP